jgi:exodeoxyribonuclease VII small subunit
MEPTPSFETALDQLKRTVEQLESGQLGLDDSLAAYERGVRLLAHCHGLLSNAERKVSLLVGVNEDGTAATTPFDGVETVEREPPAAPARGARTRAKARPEAVPDDDGIPY